MTTAAEDVRNRIIETLQIDLVGPDNDHVFAHECLPDSPVSWYLTGFLAPANAPLSVRTNKSTPDDGDDDLDAGGQRQGGDDEESPDKPAARKSLFPASMGLSALVPSGVQLLKVAVAWGNYELEEEEPPAVDELNTINSDVNAVEPASHKKKAKKRKRGYRRTPFCSEFEITIPGAGERPAEFVVPNSGGVAVVISARDIGKKISRLPQGTRAVSVFLVNRRQGVEKNTIPTFLFQTQLELFCKEGFVARVDPRFSHEDPSAIDPDMKIADLQYRDVCEYAVGHGVATEAILNHDQTCGQVRTDWIPQADVLRVVPGTVDGAEFSMEALGSLQNFDEAKEKLSPLVDAYRSWIRYNQSNTGNLENTRKQTAKGLLQSAELAARRMSEGIEALRDPLVLEAFRIANRAMAKQARRREVIQSQRKITEGDAKNPVWRPFQLAFILTVLKGIINPTDSDRERVDLLFFPTGGGKTEAYLGLAAFTMVLRRLREPGPESGGVSVLMRYTLRLLTLDQLSRASALICALELEREKQIPQLGSWPFEIGLWVGRAATPNKMGKKGDGDEHSALARTNRFKHNSDHSGAPIPIEDCPWCGEKFQPASFHLQGKIAQPDNLAIYCINEHCEFNGSLRMLPIVTVDEPIYRRLPAFLIATVDKFASLPWTGRVGALFGLADRFEEKKGFYGACDPGRGLLLKHPLHPPDLIIQDELHLISGPLGTIAGVYEAAIDALCTREVDGERVRPKIVASTATVRRANPQIRALFGRASVDIFPPPGPNRYDSFFAKTIDAKTKAARRYVGIAAQGQSAKVIFLRTTLALLSAAQREWNRNELESTENPADAYMTLLAYFNSLRELGGSRRIVEDEVSSRIQDYAKRKRVEPEDSTFVNRRYYEPLELTSRVNTNDIAKTKQKLALPFHSDDSVDVALATNMISVGLDIQRLGLMVVVGQPKSAAEYIQATSRVGRADERPGLVVTLLNIHKARDRSHYERFVNYHQSFYRNVEATSVTPFSPRALDRALAA
ncbi:MAG: DISARM system helicase DrmA, partial [Planctomycetota bacterium]